jgi:hypothetical protein
MLHNDYAYGLCIGITMQSPVVVGLDTSQLATATRRGFDDNKIEAGDHVKQDMA